jgi:group I intron endonuclease
MFGIIYCATNLVNGKKYIGQTVRTLYSRKRGHIRQALNENGELPFHCAIRKYGIENFEWVVLFDGVDDEDTLNVLEIAAIRKYKTQVPSGYNLLPGGVVNRTFQGCRHTPESRERIRIANLGKRLGKSLVDQYGEAKAAEIKIRLRIAVNRPEAIEKKKLSQARLLQDVDFLSRRGRAISAGLQTPESKARRSAIFEDVMNRPEVKQKNRAATKALLTDPQYRKIQGAALKAANKKPEVIRNRSLAQKTKVPKQELTVSIEEIMRMHHSGMDVGDISRGTGIRYSRVRSIIRRMLRA